MKRAALAALLALVLSVGSGASAAQAQDEVTPPGVKLEEPPIIPRPNSGEAPHEAGDRGGALQLSVLAVVITGVAGAVVHLVRQSRAARADEA